jgi:uncharacterized membrane protein YhaH (DUF805 family)
MQTRRNEVMKRFLDPEGRIGPLAFRDAAMILIGIGAVLSLLPLAAPSLALFSFASLLLLYPWLVIWVKRFHDAGKSGWMFLPVLVLWLVVGAAVHSFVSARFAPVLGPRPTNVSEAIATAVARMQATALPGTIVSVVLGLAFVLIGNALLKSDPGPNAYDPPSHMR